MWRALAKIENTIAIFTSVALVFVVTLTIVQRLFPDWALVGILELVTFFGVWLYMVGALIASRERGHLVVDFLELNMRSKKLKALHGIAVALIIFVICVFFVYLSYRMLAWNLRFPQHTPGLSIPLWAPQSAIMVAAIGGAGYAIRDFLINCKKLANKK